jgi:hypothetical protein
LAESQQEKVTSPHISPEEKHQYVLNFIRLRANGLVRWDYTFDDFLTRYLEESRFVSLLPDVKLSEYLNRSKAVTYFEYLLSVASKTRILPSDKLEEAFNQAYAVISSLVQYMKIDRPIQDLVDWNRVKFLEARLQRIETELSSLKALMNQRHQEIVNNFMLILDWEKEAKETLARAKEYFDGLIRGRGSQSVQGES